MAVTQLRRRILPIVLVAVIVSACSETSAPEVPGQADGSADPVLVEGREVFQSNCTRCHGDAGGGGAGPSLRGGWPDDREPDRRTMIEIVTEGRGAMPRFGGSLSPEEIEAVVSYVREVL